MLTNLDKSLLLLAIVTSAISNAACLICQESIAAFKNYNIDIFPPNMQTMLQACHCGKKKKNSSKLSLTHCFQTTKVSSKTSQVFVIKAQYEPLRLIYLSQYSPLEKNVAHPCWRAFLSFIFPLFDKFCWILSAQI